MNILFFGVSYSCVMYGQWYRAVMTVSKRFLAAAVSGAYAYVVLCLFVEMK